MDPETFDALLTRSAYDTLARLGDKVRKEVNALHQEWRLKVERLAPAQIKQYDDIRARTHKGTE